MDKKEEDMSYEEAISKSACAFYRFPLIEVRGVPLMSIIAQNWSSIWAFCPDPSDLLIATYPKAGTTWVQEIVDLLLHSGDAEICKRAPTPVRIPFLEITSPRPVPSVESLQGTGTYASPGFSDVFLKNGILPTTPRIVVEIADGNYTPFLSILMPALSFYNQTGLDLIKAMKPPRFIKTHLPIQLVPEGFWENKCKVIYVARNAKDNMVSYYHFDQMNLTQPDPGPWEEYVQKFMKGTLSWGSWYDHVKGYWKEREKRNILYLFYEDMKENPRREILRIMRYLDLSLSDDIIDKIINLTSFQVMKDNPMANYSTIPKEVFDFSISPFMRKGEVGDWTNYFTPTQSQMFDEDYARQMADMNIPFRTSI